MSSYKVFRTVALVLAAAAALSVSDLSAAVRKSPRSKIYHGDWIDFNKNGIKDVYEDPTAPLESRVQNLLSQMTMEEKTCQLVTLYGYGRVLADSLPTAAWKERVWKDGVANIDEMLNGVGRGFRTAYDLIYPFSNHVKALHEVQRFFVEETRLGIPVEFSNEGIHGLNHTKATSLPAPIGIGSTWDRAIVRQAGEIAGLEAQLLGYHSVYAPILDIARDQRWGRTVETYGEDPYLVAELGTQMAGGIQRPGVASGLKHFAAYSVPSGGRDGNARTDPQINPRDLHQLYLYPFEQVIRRVHPMVVMSSYNDWNGEPVSASYYFLTELLRDTYGFDGYVVSDSQAVEFMYSKHEITTDMEGAAKAILEAGLNVRTNFWQPETFVEPLREAIRKGDISMETIDRRVSEVLRYKFRLGLFDDPYTGDEKEADAAAGLDKHLKFAHDICAESMVLLKNEGNLLPLEKGKVGKVLVTGPLADATKYMTSRYGPNGLEATSVLSGIRSYLEGSGTQVLYSKGCEVKDATWPESEIIPQPLTDAESAAIEAAVAAAREADIVIAVMGEDEETVGESLSRTSLDLPGRQHLLLEALYKTGKPIVLVLINGQPLTVNWENAYLPAILEAWFPNHVGGQVVAETLFGDINPGGHLTVTFPKSVGQIPWTFPFKKGSHGGQAPGPNGGGKTRVLGSLYPFGYGLSYTTFGYDGLSIREKGDGNWEVSCTVTNTGSRQGDEVVQLYLRDKVSSYVAYDSVLRGFERIRLAPGERRTVSFTLTPEDMRMMDKDMHWTVESGDFEVRVGSSSEDIRLRGTITVK